MKKISMMSSSIIDDVSYNQHIGIDTLRGLCPSYMIEK